MNPLSCADIMEVLHIASRLLRRKIPQTGHLMLPRRLWMQTVPTQGCEVVLSFSNAADDAAVNWLAGRLKARVPELILTLKTTCSSNRAIYLAASIDGLVKGAEDLRLFKKTKPEFGCAMREVTNAELSIFEGVEDLSSFFTSQERHTIVCYLLDSLRVTEEDVASVVPMRLGEAIVSKWKSAGLIEQVFPLHDHAHLSKLQTSWVQTFFRYQPLDSIHDYFGDKIAIYFAWLGFYTASLTFPAFIGLFFWLTFWGRDQAAEDKAFVALALLNVVWGSLWLEAWKRRSSDLVHRWGLPTDLHELLQEPRPQFKGDIKSSHVTGRLEPCYPTWKRNVFRYCVTLPVVLLCVLAVFVVMLLILKLQDHWDKWLGDSSLAGLLSWGPKILMALTISFFDEAYTSVAIWLNDRENYRADETYHNHLIVKLALFRFVNSFLALFYIAFYLQDMERLKEQLAALLLMRQIVGNIKESCVPYFMEQLRLAKLSFELFGALSPSQETSKSWPDESESDQKKLQQSDQPETASEKLSSEQLDGNKTDTDNPELRRRNVGDSCSAPSGSGGDHQDDAQTKQKKDQSGLPRSFSRARIVSQADVESNMQRYDGTFEDYLEMLIQFGYVMLFSSAFPPAAICAFLNNIIEIRSDAFKLCCVFQRPFPQRVSSIGVWQDAMEFLGLLGIMVNCMLIGQSGQVHRMFPEMTRTQTILLIIVLEHAMIAIKYTISYAIADSPEWVIEEQAKAEFRRREALRRISSSNSPPTRDNSQPSSPRLSSVAGVSTEFTESNMNVTEFSKKQNTLENKIEYIKKQITPENKIETTITKRIHAHEMQLLNKFSIPEFSALKSASHPNSPSSRKEPSQELSSFKKIPTTPEASAINKLATPELPSPRRILTPESPADMKISIGDIDEIPSYGDKNNMRRSISSSSTSSEKSKPPLPRSASRVHNQVERHSQQSDQASFQGSDNSPLMSAPPEVDQKKRQFSFTPEDPKTIVEETRRSSDEKGSMSSSSHSVNSAVGSPGHSLNQHLQSQQQLFGADKPARDSITSLQYSISPKRTFPSIESLPQDVSGSPPSDSSIEPAMTKGDPHRRKPPNKFLKRAQSFSQFLKKKPILPEKRKRSGDTSRDDYYLPVSHETLEEPQGEMMVVPVEKLVSIADLTSDRQD